jgi:hypothetical protein
MILPEPPPPTLTERRAIAGLTPCKERSPRTISGGRRRTTIGTPEDSPAVRTRFVKPIAPPWSSRVYTEPRSLTTSWSTELPLHWSAQGINTQSETSVRAGKLAAKTQA